MKLEGIFAILQAEPEFGRLFNVAMTSKARLQIASITAAYDFSARESIADIGGVLGHLLQAVLDAAPQAAGVLFNLPPVIEHAAAVAADRLRLQAGAQPVQQVAGPLGQAVVGGGGCRRDGRGASPGARRQQRPGVPRAV